MNCRARRRWNYQCLIQNVPVQSLEKLIGRDCHWRCGMPGGFLLVERKLCWRSAGLGYLSGEADDSAANPESSHATCLVSAVHAYV